MANKYIGEFVLSDYRSDGETTCDGMTSDGHAIRKGALVYCKCSSVESDEWRPACRKHALEEANYQY